MAPHIFSSTVGFPLVVLCQINVTDKDTKHQDESKIFVINDNDMRSFVERKKKYKICALLFK